MRFAFLASALWLVSCASNSLPGMGDGPPPPPIDLAGCAPNCPDIATPPVDMAAPVPDFSGSDFAGLSCVTGCNHCTLGGACCPGAPNAGCCNAGEWCDNGTCRCGNGNACPMGEYCSSGGPVMGGGQCGFICCGGAGHPCPL
jgi:hypothetical protein